MDRIGKVARRFGSGRGGEGEAVGMNRRPFAGNPCNLRTGNVQQWPVDCLIDRHPRLSLLPHVKSARP